MKFGTLKKITSCAIALAVTPMMYGCIGEQVARLDNKDLKPVPKVESEDSIRLNLTDENGTVVRDVTLQDIKTAKVKASTGTSQLTLDTAKGKFVIQIPRDSVHEKDIIVSGKDSGQGYALRVTSETVTVSQGEVRTHQSSRVANAMSETVWINTETLRDDIVKTRVHLHIGGNGIAEGQTQILSLDGPEEKVTRILSTESRKIP